MKILFVIMFALLPSQVTGLALANHSQVLYFIIQPVYRPKPPKEEDWRQPKKPNKYPSIQPNLTQPRISATKIR